MGQDETVAGSGGTLGDDPIHLDVRHDMTATEDRVDSQAGSPGRPQRARKPNVK